MAKKALYNNIDK